MLLLLGDIFGALALVFIVLTAALMLLRRRILKYTKNLDLLRRVHIYVSTLGGLFLVLHVAYFITYPLTTAVLLGYISATIAGVVWITGTAFLERFKDSLFYHGSLSLAAISMMVIHAASSSTNIPLLIVYVVLGFTTFFVLFKAVGHAKKVFKELAPRAIKPVVRK
jgi:hypothetical protein